MNNLARTVLAIALAILIAGCNRSTECGIPDYTPSKPNDLSTAVLAATDMCIARWARTYARSHESAGDVADAAIAQCAGQLRALSYVSTHESNAIVAPQTPAQLQQSFRKDAMKAVFEYRQAGCR